MVIRRGHVTQMAGGRQVRTHLAGIAPPVPPKSSLPMPGPEDLKAGKRTFIIGDRYQMIDVEDSRAYAMSHGATFHLLAGSDHFFHFREDRVADLLIPALDD